MVIVSNSLLSYFYRLMSNCKKKYREVPCAHHSAFPSDDILYNTEHLKSGELARENKHGKTAACLGSRIWVC